MTPYSCRKNCQDTDFLLTFDGREILSFLWLFKDILEFPLEKRCKRNEDDVEQKTIIQSSLFSSHLTAFLPSALNFQHNAPGGSILINVMEKFPLLWRRSMSKESLGHRPNFLLLLFPEMICKIIKIGSLEWWGVKSWLRRKSTATAIIHCILASFPSLYKRRVVQCCIPIFLLSFLSW